MVSNSPAVAKGILSGKNDKLLIRREIAPWSLRLTPASTCHVVQYKLAKDARSRPSGENAEPRL
jgi:hypothetical protein